MVGDALKKYRGDLGWSLRELASRSGVSHEGIRKIEEKDRSPSEQIIRKLAKALGRSLADLMGPEGGDDE